MLSFPAIPKLVWPGLSIFLCKTAAVAIISISVSNGVLQNIEK